MTTIRVEAKSLELALVKAAGQLGVTQSDIRYRVTEEKKGWLGFFGTKVVVECWKKSLGSSSPNRNPRRDQKPSNPRQGSFRSKRTASSHSQEKLSAYGEVLREFCKGLCEKILDFF